MPENWADFLAMGGYAPYVWSSYGLAAVVVVLNVLVPWIAHVRLRRRIRNGEYDD